MILATSLEEFIIDLRGNKLASCLEKTSEIWVQSIFFIID